MKKNVSEVEAAVTFALQVLVCALLVTFGVVGSHCCQQDTSEQQGIV
jgi:hypothetical protein